MLVRYMDPFVTMCNSCSYLQGPWAHGRDQGVSSSPEASLSREVESVHPFQSLPLVEPVNSMLTFCLRGSRTSRLASKSDRMYTAWPRQICLCTAQSRDSFKHRRYNDLVMCSLAGLQRKIGVVEEEEDIRRGLERHCARQSNDICPLNVSKCSNSRQSRATHQNSTVRESMWRVVVG